MEPPPEPGDPSSGSPPTPRLKRRRCPDRPRVPAESPAPRGPILDRDEPEDVQKLRHEIHSIRVLLFRAAQRLGYDHDNGLVKQVRRVGRSVDESKELTGRQLLTDAAKDARLEHMQGNKMRVWSTCRGTRFGNRGRKEGGWQRRAGGCGQLLIVEDERSEHLERQKEGKGERGVGGQGLEVRMRGRASQQGLEGAHEGEGPASRVLKGRTRGRGQPAEGCHCG
eukprot:366296-Chlamydomonas_euryale.AAC.16